jgi:hypothetical protein
MAERTGSLVFSVLWSYVKEFYAKKITIASIQQRANVQKEANLDVQRVGS